MTGTIWRATLALVLVALVTPFQFVGILLAPTVALLIGAAAGWSDAKAYRGARTGHINTGTCVGVGALLGSMIGLALLALFISTFPEVQPYIQAIESNQEARIPANLIAPLAAVCGLIGGFVLGLIDLILAMLGGRVAVFLYQRSHPLQL